MAEPLLDALPDLIVLARREGTVIACAGGGGVGRLKPADPDGQRLESLWPAPVAERLEVLWEAHRGLPRPHKAGRVMGLARKG